jgi:hypothetical protein
MVEPAQPIVCSPGRFVISVRSPDGAKRHPGSTRKHSYPEFRYAQSGLLRVQAGDVSRVLLDGLRMLRQEVARQEEDVGDQGRDDGATNDRGN